MKIGKICERPIRFRVRSGLEMAFTLYLGFLLVKTDDQYGLGIKEIMNLFDKDKERIAALKKNVTSKDGKCLNQFKRRKNWDLTQVRSFLFDEEDSTTAHPSRPSSSSSSSGKQYFGSGSRVTPVSTPPVTFIGTPSSRPAGQQQECRELSHRLVPLGSTFCRQNLLSRLKTPPNTRWQCSQLERLQ